MRYRVYPRTGWELSEVGYGMWGLGGWTGSDDEQTLRSLSEAVALGCNFFDTAWAYGAGHSERLLAQTLSAHRDRRLYVATKVPPKNQRWIQLDDCALDDVFPADHIRHYTEASLENLGVDTIDLQQLHAWSDRWAADDRWQRVVDDLRREGLVRSWGISVNRWETTNVLRALDTGLIDCVQVVYNIFDQDPEDRLFPYCLERGIAVIARVPFDEGSLTGTLTRESHTVRQADVDRLREAGWNDKQIAEAVYVTAMFALFNRIANAFGLVDPNYHEVLGGKDVPNRPTYRDETA